MMARPPRGARTSRGAAGALAAISTIAAITSLTASFAASAGSLAVSPLRLNLTSAAAITSLIIENHGQEEALVQAETYAWSQVGAEHRLTPTEDVVAMPPVFRLAPGAQRQVRVGLTRAFADRQEVSYRLTVTEIPTVTTPGVVAVAVRHSLPIFVRPATPVMPTLVVKFRPPATLELSNSGSEHLRIDRWRLRSKTGAVIAENTGPGYLLVGASQQLAIKSDNLGEASQFEADGDMRSLKIAVE
jgi:fimbrial chaperone protein